jgi:hypothetical protein
VTPNARITRENPQRPASLEQRKASLVCKRCGSSDLWRIPDQTGFVAAIMRRLERKPFQCRACRWICYRPARRKKDNAKVMIRKRRFV